MAMNKSKFIYVFSPKDKDELLSLGYNLIKSDIKQDIYVFEDIGEIKFSATDIKFILTNTLTF